MVIRLSSLPKLSIGDIPQTIIFISSMLLASALFNYFNLEKAYAYFGVYSSNCPVYSGVFKNAIPVVGSNVTQGVYDTLNCADYNALNYNQSPTVATYGVVANTGMSDSASIPSTTKNLTLTLGAAATVGATNSAVTNVYYNVVSTFPSNATSGIIGTQTQADLSGGHTTKGWTGISLRNFTYSGYGEGWNELQLNVQIVNRFKRASDGAITFRCVAYPGSLTSSSIGSDCPITSIYIRVYVYVIPPPPTAGSCYLTASTTSPLPGTYVEITATINNFSGQNWNYNSSQTNFDAYNYTLGVVNASKPYYNIQQPYADLTNNPPTSTSPYSGPVDYDNGTVGVLPTSTVPGYRTQSYFISGYGSTGITRYGMKATVYNNSSSTFSFWVKAPPTVGQRYNIGARVMDRQHQIFSPWFWFNMDTCTVSITAASASTPASVSCNFNSISDPLELGVSFQPKMTLIRNTETGSPDVNVTFSASSDVTGTSLALSGASIGSPVIMKYNSNSTVDVTYDPITTSSTNSTVYFSGSISWSGGSNLCSKTVNIARKPFFTVLNGDLMAGGLYRPTGGGLCSGTPSGGHVASWATIISAADRRGANAEHIAKILGTATEIYSAGGISTTNPKWLTIANNDSTRPWGGNSGSASCMTNFYDDTRDTTITSTAPPSSYQPGSDPAKQKVFNNNTNISTVSNFTGQQAIYVTGNVYISGDIIMQSSYTNGISDIPFFALIVKGNIYIAPGVKQLDGMYVAQTNGATGGSIYTCGKSSYANYLQSEVYGNCKDKSLTFNGIVQAKDIKLHRTIGTFNSNSPAEVFNNLPELYLAQTPFKSNVSTSAQYDSAVTLPPAL